MKETTFEARKSLKTGGFARTFMNKNLKFIFRKKITESFK